MNTINAELGFEILERQLSWELEKAAAPGAADRPAPGAAGRSAPETAGRSAPGIAGPAAPGASAAQS